ncbi:MAG: DUF3291 domain-containing protein [Bacteroidia bacterium]|nr:DUF3291 domain-containing protein [Bacteroidia bacterium]MBT8274861.1 DUF3291 domain-containing protein [Bacteroidia bacterium]NNJ81817.1 DUF3291 domain-containing protein [Flavobacteriaceae bacterium]NNK54577.1 DUF3291 domain-containing protein [Flavobacteriaceae bacterium]NNM08634.1 DUF3291 domain-containing protein [Flavobacteriaceae bacterium]
MHLAQLNIAEAIASMDSPEMADFVNNIERINTLAESSQGYIWRLTDEGSDNSYSMQLFDSEFIVTNMSIWKDKESLFDFVYNTGHVEIFKRRKEWFHKMAKSHMVLWYINEGHIPDIEEAKERLRYLREQGESAYAFTFKSMYREEDAKKL